MHPLFIEGFRTIKKPGGYWITMIWEMSTQQTKEAACHAILVLPIFPREKSKLKLPFEWIFELLLRMHAFLWDISKCPCHHMHSSHPHNWFKIEPNFIPKSKSCTDGMRPSLLPMGKASKQTAQCFFNK